MQELPTPHNNFFHFALSDKRNARSLIRTQLPGELVQRLRLPTLQLESGSFIDPDLREKFSDLLYSVEMDPSDEDDLDEALIYVLFEHKSHIDPFTPLQLLSYVVRIWEKRVRDGLSLCPVIPLVIYHGETRWSAARSVQELVPYSVEMAEFQAGLGFKLLDLSQLADSGIDGEPLLQSTLQLLKYSRSQQLLERLVDILAVVVREMPERELANWVDAIGSYVVSANDNLDQVQYKQTLASVLPTKYVVGSIADQLLTQGREEGREAGLEEGLEVGGLIGQIRLSEQLLDLPLSPPEELRASGRQSMQDYLTKLQQQLRDRLS